MWLVNPHVENEGNNLTAKFRQRAPHNEMPKAITFDPGRLLIVVGVGFWYIRKKPLKNSIKEASNVVGAKIFADNNMVHPSMIV